MTDAIAISPAGEESKRLWEKALELSRAFGAGERWVLVGGLMVQLHAFERNTGSRLTGDVDFLGDSQRRPSMTKLMAETLVKHGADMAVPPVSNEGLGYQFEVDGETIEILGSEGVRRDPKTLGRYRTIQVPGGRQALARAEVVSVSLDGADPTPIRRPRRDPDQGSGGREAARQAPVRPRRPDPPAELRRGPTPLGRVRGTEEDRAEVATEDRGAACVR